MICVGFKILSSVWLVTLHPVEFSVCERVQAISVLECVVIYV
jgi:hypothetical protein